MDGGRMPGGITLADDALGTGGGMIASASTADKDAIRRDESALRRELIAAGCEHIRGQTWRCGFHEDRNPSAGIHCGADGVWRFKCHGGSCGFSGDVWDVIARASGRTAAAVLREGQRHDGNGQQRKPDPAPTRPRHTYISADAAIEAAGRSIDGGKLATVWKYPGDTMRVARFNKPNGDKEFRPVHKLENGSWAIGDPPGPLPLYKGDELPPDGPILVLEGEKCCDLARAIGLAAVTSSHGSNAADKSDWAPLSGREVWVFPDNDAAGERYAQDVLRILIALGCKVKIIRLPGLTPGGDIVEFDAEIAGEPQDTKAAIEELAAKSPVEAAPASSNNNGQAGPVLTCVADVEARAINWLWPQRIPAGRITLVVGRPGAGKSFLCSEITARVTTGSPWPDGRGGAAAGDVLIISAEDDAHDTTRPRLDAARADVRRVHLLTAVKRIDSDGKPMECVFTLADVRNLELAFQQFPSLKLAIIDPIGSYLGAATDAHRDNEVRSILAPVAKLAEQYGVAVLIVAHRRKAGGDTADDTALGSRAFTGIARAVWHLSRDPQDKTRRLFLPGKQNLSEEPDGMAFTISGNPAAIQWEADPVRMNADDAMADERTPGPEPEAREAAEVWLRELLAGGEVESNTVKEQAKDAGIAWRTVRRAADELGVKREKNTFTGKWQWRLPKPGNQLVQVPGQHETLGQLGQLGHLSEETE